MWLSGAAFVDYQKIHQFKEELNYDFNISVSVRMVFKVDVTYKPYPVCPVFSFLLSVGQI